ncbi:hypothetical protein [Flexivirga sp. B27]
MRRPRCGGPAPTGRGAVGEKLAVATDARATGRTAADAARLVGWIRANLYRHQAEAGHAPAAAKSAR